MQLLQTLENHLRKEPNFFSDNGELKKWVVLSKAQNMDEELIGLLLENEELKAKFFIKIKDAKGENNFVFNLPLFSQFLEQKNYLNDSYTAYKNKIGLTIDGKYLKQRNEVALVWPFKDCILEGGQSTEEQRREEIFFNEILAQDEITQLLEPKVLTGAKKFSKDGEEVFKGFKRDVDGTIKDNLIIKGNNLLALHSLKKEFAGKVKLIYIDPPYNTGGSKNIFSYNNTFNHSSWLVFMKNRLSVAKDFLCDDGVIQIAIDENEQPYLGVLIDEIFQGYEKHCITIIHNPRGVQGNNFSYTNEFVYFVFKKGLNVINKIKREESIEEEFKDHGGESTRNDAKNCFYPVLVKNNKIIGFGDVPDDSFHPTKNVVRQNGIIEVYPIDTKGIERKWVFARQTVDSIVDKLFVKDKQDGQIDIFRIKDEMMPRTVWTGKRYDASTFGSKIVNKVIDGKTVSFPKSLFAVIDCLSSAISIDKDDIIMDFFGGSGTTAHAVIEINKASKRNHKFIIIEQLEQHIEVAKKRIEQEINDSFIYLELKKHNQAFIDKIEVAKNTDELLKIWQEMKERSFLNYNLDIKKQEEHLEDFKALSLENQKQHLVEILDKNQLYVNLSSLEDQDFGCSKEEKQITKDFYKIK